MYFYGSILHIHAKHLCNFFGTDSKNLNEFVGVGKNINLGMNFVEIYFSFFFVINDLDFVKFQHR